MDAPPPTRPTLIYDGDCSFCKAWIEYWKSLTGGRIRYVSYQEAAPEFPEIPPEEFGKAVQFVLPDGEVRAGAHAVFTSLKSVPGKGWMLGFYERVPGFAAVSDVAYRVIARHRSLGYKVTRFFWGLPVLPPTYRLASCLFLRLLGLIYLIAFLSFGVQAPGLIGSRGILPVAEFLPAARQYLGAGAFWNVPTVLWISPSDAFIRATWIAGVCLSLAMFLGLNWRPVRVALFVLYLSLCSASQIFLGYQWDALLLEAGFLAIFLGSSSLVPRLFRWLLFRLMFLSGAVKLLSGGHAWRSFTALAFHYQTQPIPTPVAWYAFQLPRWFQRMSVGVVFAVELIFPFFIYLPRRVRIITAAVFTIFQLLIFLTGNYAFFNLLAVALCVFLLDDQLLSRLLRKPASKPLVTRWPVLRDAACRTLAGVVFFVSGFQMMGMFSGFHWAPAEMIIAAISPFEVVNTYGLFAVMTTTRPEIMLEGSNDGATWLAYEFKYKPGDPSRCPPWVEPHQPRLDWQMWFAALGDYETDPWTLHLAERLLQGSPDVLKLFAKNPFPNAPPRFIRATLYEYRFTTPAERKTTGNWWHREVKGPYLPSISLRQE